MRRLLTVLAFSLSAISARAEGQIELRVLYCGERGSEREQGFQQFLSSHFKNIALQDLLTFKEADAKDYDVVIFDWSSVFRPNGGLEKEKWQAMRKTPPLSSHFRRPAILIGAAGGTVASPLNLKIDWLCLCLAGPAHHVQQEHKIFHSPLKVNPQFEKLVTPQNYADLTIDESLGKEMTVWQVQTKIYPQVDPGLVSTLYGFADSPDAEVFAQGIAMKGPDTVALGRHANFFLWGFSASPQDMTEAGKRLFVNAVSYMVEFDGQTPLVQKTATAREWALRNALIPRLFTKKSQDYETQQMRKGVQEDKSLFQEAIDQQFGGDVEAFVRDRVTKANEAERQWMDDVIPKPLRDKFGMDSDKYLAYYRENFEFLYPDEKNHFRLLVDEDAKAVGPSNRRIELLDRCIAMLDRNDRPEVALRLLKRYTALDLSSANEWRTWLEQNRNQLFFSDAGGYKFFVSPR